MWIATETQLHYHIVAPANLHYINVLNNDNSNNNNNKKCFWARYDERYTEDSAVSSSLTHKLL